MRFVSSGGTSLKARVFAAVALAALGCTGQPSPVPTGELPIDVAPNMPLGLVFEAIDAAPAQPYLQVVASQAVRVAGARHELTWRPLLREGEQLRSGDYGLLVDATGRALELPTCGSADYGGLVQAHGEVFHVGHLECQPGAIWVARLAQDEAGVLSPIEGYPTDLSAMHGGKNFCAGEVTAWGSVLSAAEYDPNASLVGVSGEVLGQPVGEYDPTLMARYHVPTHRPYAYDHGWMVEVTIDDAQGHSRGVPRYAMGRFSHEQARVMPDRRTVYLSDDANNGGLFLFVADLPGDLSSGTLYAARFEQRSGRGGGQGALSWVSLGHTTDADVGLALASGTLHFDDLFEEAGVDPETDRCVDGYQRVVDTWGRQCLRRREGLPGPVLARLESRRMAALAGATTEFRKAEGMAYDPDHDMLYLSITRIDGGMQRGSVEWDDGGPDHIGVPENRCGGVYALPIEGDQIDIAGEAIDSDYVATSMRGFILGRPEGLQCAPGIIANPDNLTYLPGSGTLMIGEDTPHHKNNLLWAVDVAALHGGGLASITPILAAPPGGEVTGIDWFPDINGHGYLTTTIQHPFRGHPLAEQQPAEALVSTFGVWGPFPRLVVPEVAGAPAERPVEAPAPPPGDETPEGG